MQDVSRTAHSVTDVQRHRLKHTEIVTCTRLFRVWTKFLNYEARNIVRWSNQGI